MLEGFKIHNKGLYKVRDILWTIRLKVGRLLVAR
jgi:hypothetical protein